MSDWSYISKEDKLMSGCYAAKSRLTLLFGGNTSGTVKLKPPLGHSETPRALENIAKGSLLLCGRVTPNPGLHRPFSRTSFSTTLSQRYGNIAWRRMSHQHSFAAQQCFRPPPIHGWLSFQHKNCASATEYYITHPTYGPGVTVPFKKYYSCHTFCQAAKANDKSEQHFDHFGRTITSPMGL